MDKRRVVGILGGGQLGLMLAEAASPLDIPIVVLDPTPDGAPARRVAKQIIGDFKNEQFIKQLAQESDILTYEIEHVDVDAVETCVKASAGKVRAEPQPETVRIIQDKYRQKVFLKSFGGVPIGDFSAVNSASDIHELALQYGYPIMLKSKRLAYDGKGNAVIKSAEDIGKAITQLGDNSESGRLYAEKWVTFTKELAVMVAKSTTGDISCYPVVETMQRDSICHLVIAPANIDQRTAELAQRIAMDAVSRFDGAGIFGVELFLLKDGQVLFNEIAPRPHNSGHYTIEACYTSQYEQHLRAILGMPLGNGRLKVGASVMLNILGEDSGEAGMAKALSVCTKALAVTGASVHWYGKKECRKGRKMGHITLVGPDMSTVVANLAKITGERGDSRLTPPPVVGVIMGSDSDLGVMKACAEVLRDFEVPFEVTIVSAHRTPDRLVQYSRGAHERGIKVIIAAAGGAAHLPGMAAALTPLPVIGVPIALKHLDGVDSLHSIVQMPRGVPVATVAINNSTNAALLAIRILGCSSIETLRKMMKYQKRMEESVYEKIDKLASVGWEAY